MNNQLKIDYVNDSSADNMIRGSRSPSSSPRASQRLRQTPFVWNRFIGPNQKEYKPIRVTERPNLRIVKSIVDFYPDDSLVRTNTDKLTGIIRDFEHKWGAMDVSYVQTDYSKYKADGYNGVTKFGRYYGGSFTGLSKKLFNTFFKESHVQLDLESSYQTMFRNAFRHLHLPALDEYVNNRDAIFDGFQSELGLSRNEVKGAINSMFSTHPYYSRTFGLDGHEEATLHAFSEHAFTVALKKDLKTIGDEFLNTYKPFYDTVCLWRKTKPDNDSRRDLGVAMGFLAQDMEASVMRCMIKEVGTNDLYWKFDAIIIPKDLIGRTTVDSFINNLTEVVKSKTGISIRLNEKNMREDSFAMVLPPSDIRGTEYDIWKMEFERKFFKLDNPPRFCMIHDDGITQILSEADFRHVNMEQNEEFRKKWLSDPSKRKYIGLDFAPPPLEVKSGYYNTWSGFAASKLPENDGDVDITPYLNHVRLLMGGDDSDAEVSTEFMHNCLAYKFQCPGLRTRVAHYLRSTQGVGKDLWGDFMSMVMGRRNVVKVTKFGDLMGFGSPLREAKILCIISEMNYHDNVKYMDDLKNQIVQSEAHIRAKNVGEYFIRDSIEFVGFSNNFNAIQITSDDRRFHVVTCSGRYANDADYFRDLVPWFDQPENQRAVYDFYMNRNIAGFNPSESRPRTKAHKSVARGHRYEYDIFLRTAFPVWINHASSGYSSDTDYKIIGGEETGILRINTGIHLRDFFECCSREGWEKEKSDGAKKNFMTTVRDEAIARMQRYQSNDKVAVMNPNVKTHGVRYYKISIPDMKRYLSDMVDGGIDDQEDEIEESNMAVGFQPGRGN